MFTSQKKSATTESGKLCGGRNFFNYYGFYSVSFWEHGQGVTKDRGPCSSSKEGPEGHLVKAAPRATTSRNSFSAWDGCDSHLIASSLYLYLPTYLSIYLLIDRSIYLYLYLHRIDANRYPVESSNQENKDSYCVHAMGEARYQLIFSTDCSDNV